MITRNIPKSPGCYIYKDRKGKIIYIGKAKDLRKRVSSYFQKKDHDIKTRALVEHIDSVDFIATDTEVEALILENTLIKRHKPKYNIDLKDSKRFAYLELTDEKFPRIIVARKKDGKGRYFGPFVSANDRDSLRRFLVRTFRLRTCRRMPKKPCLRFHINLCDAPCSGNISEKDYDEKIKKSVEILKGRTDSLIRKMEEDIRRLSARQEYEKAKQLRDEMYAASALRERQKADLSRKHDEDIINFIVKDNYVYLVLFNIYKGILGSKHEFSFAYRDDFLEEFIVQYYDSAPVPKELVLPQDISDAAAGYLSHKKGQNVIVTVPKQGTKKELLLLVKKNIGLSFFGDMEKVEELQKRLKLNDLPLVIECFDISHLSGTAMVGSMVQFRNGKADKPNYRRFRIKSVEGIDDFAAIAEVVRRRYRRLKDEGADLPNLILIDGGKGQLSAAAEELSRLGLKIPIISIAKKLEEIYFPGSKFPLRLDGKDLARLFVQEIRDEAHRFAIAYNRLLRGKMMKE